MTNFGRKVAYQSTRNFLCAQIAYTKEKISWYNENEKSDYLDDRKEELKAYQIMLLILTENQKKIRDNDL